MPTWNQIPPQTLRYTLCSFCGLSYIFSHQKSVHVSHPALSQPFSSIYFPCTRPRPSRHLHIQQIHHGRRRRWLRLRCRLGWRLAGGGGAVAPAAVAPAAMGTAFGTGSGGTWVVPLVLYQGDLGLCSKNDMLSGSWWFQVPASLSVTRSG